MKLKSINTGTIVSNLQIRVDTELESVHNAGSLSILGGYHFG